MNWFAWQGMSQSGKTIKGCLQASSLEELEKQLRAKDIALLEAKPTNLQTSSFGQWRHTLSSTELLDFFGNLALLLTSGIPLLNALDIMKNQTQSKKITTILQDIKSDISKGSTLAGALAQFPKTFSPFIIHLVAAGEKTGHLGPVLEHLKNYLNATITLRAQLKKALMMPLITFSLSLTLLWVILIFVIPHFSTLYQSLGCSIPASTQFVIHLSNLFSSWLGFIFVASVIPVFFIIKNCLKIPSFKQKIHSVLLHVPFVGTLSIQREVFRLLELLTLFLRSGFPLTQALEHAQQSTSTTVFQNHIQHLLTMIIEGKTLSQGLEEIGSPFFDAHLIALVAVGEHANALAPMLEKATTLYKNRLSATLHTLSTIAAPLFMVGVGIIIGGLMILMYLPILNLGTLLGAQ